MSDDCYMTRLRWHNGRGAAKLQGVLTPLTEPPDLGRGPVSEVEYVPLNNWVYVRYGSEPKRDMEPDEIAAADQLLKALTRGD